MVATPYKSTAHLSAGAVILFKHTEYTIVKVKPRNYLVARAHDGKNFNLNRWAAIEDTGKKNPTAVAEALAMSAQVTVTPTLTIGTEVRITGRGAGRFEGRTGVIVKVNTVRYGVMLPDSSKVNVPFSMVVPTAVNELDIAPQIGA